MRPTKNRVVCPVCGYQKMHFKSKREALRFLWYNAETIYLQTGKRPKRAYYCDSCCAWHVTSKPTSHSRKHLIDQYGDERGIEIFDMILPLISNRNSVERGLAKRIKRLKHNLKFPKIDYERCKAMIDELIKLFEVIYTVQLADREALAPHFEKFSALCDIYTEKYRQMA